MAGRLHLSAKESPEMKSLHEVEKGLKAFERLKDPLTISLNFEDRGLSFLFFVFKSQNYKNLTFTS